MCRGGLLLYVHISTNLARHVRSPDRIDCLTTAVVNCVKNGRGLPSISIYCLHELNTQQCFWPGKTVYVNIDPCALFISHVLLKITPQSKIWEVWGGDMPSTAVAELAGGEQSF